MFNNNKTDGLDPQSEVENSLTPQECDEQVALLIQVVNKFPAWLGEMLLAAAYFQVALRIKKYQRVQCLEEVSDHIQGSFEAYCEGFGIDCDWLREQPEHEQHRSKAELH